jgi:preprotein translocase subunit SecA
VIFRYEREKWKAIVEEIVEVHKQGRPILVGTTTVEKSEKLGEMLKRRGIKYELLNAKPEYAAREAEIVAQAGRLGAVTIATNMAGRGTDIILGGNPEFLAWARLKNQYPTRLDVPPDVWKRTVEEIEAKEKMKEEGRRVAELGGLHIIGTERHDARRIDNQLRGRAGRQGDPGSSRFFLSLEDDLMRIFAGEWVAAILTRLGMEEGQSIESPMVSRRIEAAQKKIEERHFDIRKNLLEYDEVMDYQRRKVYSYRQEILDGANCRLRILGMLREQITLAVDRLMDDAYGAESFAEFAANRLGVEFDGADFTRSDFAEATRTAKDKAARQATTLIQEALDENLNPDVDPKEWNWEALAKFVSTRWGLKTTGRELKQIGRDGLVEHLLPQVEEAIEKVDLADGAAMLEPDYGRQSVCAWARQKFGLTVRPEELADKDPEEIKDLLWERTQALYTQKDIEFPVQVALANFMSDRPLPGGGQRYNREGLYQWAKERFADAAHLFSEDAFRTHSRSQLRELLLEASRKCYPADGYQRIAAALDRHFADADVLREAKAAELAAWARDALRLTVDAAALTGQDRAGAEQVLANAFDDRYRPEMRGMERWLLLDRLDYDWKDHLYAMDHLRSGIGLVGYAQVDPKTEYKREGMKLFDKMWEDVQAKVTDYIFRMEEVAQYSADARWQISATVHEQAPRGLPTSDGMRAQQDAAIAGSQQSDKKIEPIRNRGQRVGRNDPCPCGSGKKYKNCCMRTAV